MKSMGNTAFHPLRMMPSFFWALQDPRACRHKRKQENMKANSNSFQLDWPAGQRRWFYSQLCSHETPFGILHPGHPGLELLAQERQEPVGAIVEEGHRNYQRAGAPFLWGKPNRVSIVKPGEEKVLGIIAAFWYLKGWYYKKDGGKLYVRVCCHRARANDFKLKEDGFRLDIKKIFLWWGW